MRHTLPTANERIMPIVGERIMPIPSERTTAYPAVNGRGQIQGQVFIYILTIVVVGLLLLFGYRFFQSLLTQGCDVQEIQFKTDIENALRQNTGYQSVTPLSFDAPCGYVRLCFVDSTSIATRAGDRAVTFTDPVGSKLLYVRDSVQANVLRNVFLLTRDGGIGGRTIYSPFVVIEDTMANYTCMDSSGGKFNILLTGTGQAARVSEYSP